MSSSPCFTVGLLLVGALALLVNSTLADTFGAGPNTFSLDFVAVGNPGNVDDAGGGGGIYSYPSGGVGYQYRIGKFEVSQEQIVKATASGLLNVIAGPHTGAEPATNIQWYEAAAFVNWLNTSTAHHAAYDLTWNGSAWTMNVWSAAQAWDNDPGAGVDLNLYRHKDACYFLPSEDEWYKAAYHKNDGVTANYWDYATGSNTPPTQSLTGGTVPNSAVYNGTEAGAPADPADVNLAGGLSPYGTMGQNGNVQEWNESATDGTNDSPSENRGLRGGFWNAAETGLRPSQLNTWSPANSDNILGFRVASVPDIDTDGDGIFDHFETGTGIYISAENTGTSPGNPDTDGDGLNDGQEVNIYLSNPNIRDTDGDGFDDGFEVVTGFSPTSATSTPDALSTALPAIEYRFNAANGISYRIEVSTDLVNWTTIETNIIGTGGVITRFFSIEGQTRRFFRSRRN